MGLFRPSVEFALRAEGECVLRICFANYTAKYFFVQSVKKVTLGPLFRSKNDENGACVTKYIFGA